MMDYNKTAADILQQVGGAPNVGAVSHCSTRLRFNLVDDGKADLEALKRIPGVLGAVQAGQTQIVIGNEVVEVYGALLRLPGVGVGAAAAAPSGEKKKRAHPGRVFVDFLVAVFQPLVPAIAGAGILKSLLMLLTVLGWMDPKGDAYAILIAIPNAVFYFLPLMVAVTTATKLGTDKLVALAAVSVLILPSLTTLVASDTGLHLFGFAVTNVNYSTQVFPAILAVLFLSVNERFWTKVSPKPIRIFFVPMMSLLITVPITLFVLGPLGFQAGTWFTAGIVWLYATLGWVATALLAMLLPFLISVGMHKALLPPTINQITTTGKESLYNPASLAHNISEAGSSFGVAIRTKSPVLRATAISAGISALFSITEPSLYGVTLQNKRALISVLSGCFAGGAYLGLTHVTSFAAVGPGLASMSMFLDPSNPMNLVNAGIGAGIAFVVAMAVSLTLWKDSASATLIVAHDPAATAEQHTVTAVSPAPGIALPLSEVNDPVFSGGVLGAGLAIVPQSGEFHAPISGTVAMVFDSHHAIGLTTDDGVELLIHVGLDTVRLNGEHFTAHVAKGDRVEAGQLLLTADLPAIAAAGYDITTPIVVTNSTNHEVTPIAPAGHVAVGAPLFGIAVDVKEPADVVS